MSWACISLAAWWASCIYISKLGLESHWPASVGRIQSDAVAAHMPSVVARLWILKLHTRLTHTLADHSEL